MMTSSFGEDGLNWFGKWEEIGSCAAKSLTVGAVFDELLVIPMTCLSLSMLLYHRQLHV